MTVKRSLTLLLVSLSGCGSDVAVVADEEPTYCSDVDDGAKVYCDPAGASGPCSIAPPEYAEACHEGCLFDVCSLFNPCPEGNPSWCESSCADLNGPRFWKVFLDMSDECLEAGSTESKPFASCTRARVEKACPELGGTPWADAIPILVPAD